MTTGEIPTISPTPTTDRARPGTRRGQHLGEYDLRKDIRTALNQLRPRRRNQPRGTP